MLCPYTAWANTGQGERVKVADGRQHLSERVLSAMTGEFAERHRDHIGHIQWFARFDGLASVRIDWGLQAASSRVETSREATAQRNRMVDKLAVSRYCAKV
jgi:hypothetical protein